jgi:hypothetical protein
MLKEGSCNVERRVSRRRGSDGHLYESAVVYCRSCGAGSVKTWRDDLLQSFTTTDLPFASCVGHGVLLRSVLDWPTSLPTPSGTPEQHGSCVLESTHGKQQGRSA